MDAIESSAIGAYVDLVLHLNEAAFRPVFLHTVDWASVEMLADSGSGVLIVNVIK